MGQKVSCPLPRVHWPSAFWWSRAVTSLPQVQPSTTSSARSRGTSRHSRPMTMPSSASWSTRSLSRGSRTGSPGPTTDVDGLRNTTGLAGASVPISAAWSA